jgi:transposase
MKHSLARRLQAVRLYAAMAPNRHRVASVAARVNASRASVYSWIRQHETHGVSGLERKSGSSRLTGEQQRALFDLLYTRPVGHQATKRWRVQDIRRLIHDSFGRLYSEAGIYRLRRVNGWPQFAYSRRPIQICPACKERQLAPVRTYNALSRFVKDTDICSDCGVTEAFYGFFWKLNDVRQP